MKRRKPARMKVRRSYLLDRGYVVDNRIKLPVSAVLEGDLEPLIRAVLLKGRS